MDTKHESKYPKPGNYGTTVYEGHAGFVVSIVIRCPSSPLFPFWFWGLLVQAEH